MKKKPDQVVDNPGTMTYGTDLAAPAFTLPDVTGFKKAQAAEAGHRFHQRYNELEQQMQELMTQAQYNDRLLRARISFKPNIGKIYFLYNRNNEDYVSMLSPQDWGTAWMQQQTFVGAYKLLSDNVWVEIET